MYKESDLRGRIGTVITGIPVDGYGEVMIENISGRISKPAVSFTKSEIPYGKKSTDHRHRKWSPSSQVV